MEIRQKIITFLMFNGKAEEAMDFYISLFEDSGIINITRYGEEDVVNVGKVMYAAFKLNGQEFMCIDSIVNHNFTFSPAISLFINCDSAAEIDRLFNLLSEKGKVYMPLSSYQSTEKFGWVEDRFGVSWQLNLDNLK